MGELNDAAGALSLMDDPSVSNVPHDPSATGALHHCDSRLPVVGPLSVQVASKGPVVDLVVGCVGYVQVAMG
jgi:hypothetical protein